jgi:DNA-binding response OmpR family regulator
MRLLLVEDSPQLADATARGLREHGHAVDIGGTLAEARRLARVEPYDAILLDLGLPDGNGMMLLDELRRAKSSVPILVLTARDALDDRITGLDHGADDYLVKPFALEELVARLRAVARRSAEYRPDDLTIDTLRLDIAARRAWCGARELTLTTTEFSLLEYLVRHAGEVIGRARISEKVWDANYDPASNIIAVYVARLRKKVDGPDDRPLLRTIRGAGYSLAAEEG